MLIGLWKSDDEPTNLGIQIIMELQELSSTELSHCGNAHNRHTNTMKRLSNFFEA